MQNFSKITMRLRRFGRHAPQLIKRPLIKAWLIVERFDIEYQSRNASINPAPILILGNQKSGTSAIASLLSEMTGLSVSVDLIKETLYKHRTYPRIRKGDVSFAQFIAMHRLAFSRDIVKEANLTVFYDELVNYFPNAKFVFIARDPRDNIRSQLNRMGIPGGLPQLERTHQILIPWGWDIIIDGRWLGLYGENYIEMLAARWNLLVDVYLKHTANMTLIRYEDFEKDKIGEIARLAHHLGLVQLNNIAGKVDKQFQPRGNRDTDWNMFFGQDNLASIERICSDRMQRLHYYPLLAETMVCSDLSSVTLPQKPALRT